MNLWPVAIMHIKPKYSYELAKGSSKGPSLYHPEYGSFSLNISKVHSGIKLSNELLVPFFLKTHKSLDVLFSTCTYDFLK